MQHLEICLLTDLPIAGAYFSFQLTFKIIVLLSGSYRHKMEQNCCRVSISVLGFSSRKVPQRDLSMAAFCWFMRYIAAEYRKKLLNMSKF